MRNVVQVDQFTEVGVKCYEYSTLCIGASEQGSVARIRAKLRRVDNIVPFRPQPSRNPSADTPVNEKSHDSPTFTVAKVSPATTAWA